MSKKLLTLILPIFLCTSCGNVLPEGAQEQINNDKTNYHVLETNPDNTRTDRETFSNLFISNMKSHIYENAKIEMTAEGGFKETDYTELNDLSSLIIIGSLNKDVENNDWPKSYITTEYPVNFSSNYFSSLSGRINGMVFRAYMTCENVLQGLLANNSLTYMEESYFNNSVNIAMQDDVSCEIFFSKDYYVTSMKCTYDNQKFEFNYSYFNVEDTVSSSGLVSYETFVTALFAKANVSYYGKINRLDFDFEGTLELNAGMTYDPDLGVSYLTKETHNINVKYYRKINPIRFYEDALCNTNDRVVIEESSDYKDPEYPTDLSKEYTSSLKNYVSNLIFLLFNFYAIPGIVLFNPLGNNLTSLYTELEKVDVIKYSVPPLKATVRGSGCTFEHSFNEFGMITQVIHKKGNNKIWEANGSYYFYN